MTTFRQTAPLIKGVEKINFEPPVYFELPSGAPLFIIKGGEQEVVKIDLVFKAGNWYEASKLESWMAAAMLTEGTIRLKAAEIVDKIDFYGAQLGAHSHFDNSYLTILSLKKHLPQLLPLLAEMVQESTLPHNEFEIVRQKRKQSALVDAEKVSLMAQRQFLRSLFGNNHPYAPISTPEQYDLVTREGATRHYKSYYSSNRLTIVASGDVDESVISMIDKWFGQNWNNNNININRTSEIISLSEKQIYLPKDGANQNAISIGRRVPPQMHPDSQGLKILSAILGGYFGSRLMSNLREEKGITYGIQSSIISFVHEAVFLIHAEVATQHSKEAVSEIFIEMKKLSDKLISKKELEPLRNYLTGRLLEDFDGPFARAQSFTSLYEAGLEVDYFSKTLETIRTITPKQIRTLARHYFDPESMITVVAGQV